MTQDVNEPVAVQPARQDGARSTVAEPRDIAADRQNGRFGRAADFRDENRIAPLAYVAGVLCGELAQASNAAGNVADAKGRRLGRMPRIDAAVL